jgi:hypothetical protein
MIYNKLPFWADTELGIFEAIRTEDLIIPDSREISSGLLDLLQSILIKDPSKRIKMHEIKTH